MEYPITWLFILGVILAICAFDVWLLVRRGPEATVSWRIRWLGEKWVGLPWVVAFAMGILFCHFFMPCP